MGVVSKEAMEREQKLYELRKREVEALEKQAAALEKIAEYLKPRTYFSVDTQKLKEEGYIK